MAPYSRIEARSFLVLICLTGALLGTYGKDPFLIGGFLLLLALGWMWPRAVCSLLALLLRCLRPLRRLGRAYVGLVLSMLLALLARLRLTGSRRFRDVAGSWHAREADQGGAAPGYLTDETPAARFVRACRAAGIPAPYLLQPFILTIRYMTDETEPSGAAPAAHTYTLY